MNDSFYNIKAALMPLLCFFELTLYQVGIMMRRISYWLNG